mgnify:FL=1|jgi:hypothetical protein
MPDLFKPRRVAVKIHYSMISQFMYVWVKWNRPCDLSVQRLRENPVWLGVCFNVENNDALDMMEDVRKSLKTEIIDL